MNVTSGAAGNPLPIYTAATLPSANSVSTGFKVRVSDLGAYGTEMYSNGTIWLPTNGIALLANLTSPVAGVTNTESLALQTLIPAGLLKAGFKIRLDVVPTKNGTTDAYISNLRVGTAGTTSDTALTGFSNYALMPAGVTCGGGIVDIRIVSATSMQRLGNSNVNLGTYSTLSGSGSVAAATTGLPDSSSNGLWLSLGIKSAGTTNTVGLDAASFYLIAG